MNNNFCVNTMNYYNKLSLNDNYLSKRSAYQFFKPVEEVKKIVVPNNRYLGFRPIQQNIRNVGSNHLVNVDNLNPKKFFNFNYNSNPIKTNQRKNSFNDIILNSCVFNRKISNSTNTSISFFNNSNSEDNNLNILENNYINEKKNIKNISNKMNLKIFSDIINKVYFENKFDIVLFDKLNEKEKWVLELFFEILYQQKINLPDDFEKIGKCTNYKTKTDKIKFIYSKFKRNMMESYKQDYYNVKANKIKRENNIDNDILNDKDLFRDLKTGYNYFLFKDHFDNKVDDIDFIMDVLMGIPLTIKGKQYIKTDQNWRSKDKGTLANWISPIYKYYLVTSKNAKTKFCEFLLKKTPYNNQSEFWLMTITDLQRTLKIKYEWFADFYKKYNNLSKTEMRNILADMSAFKKKKKNTKKTSFKLPWLFADINDAIDTCFKEFELENVELFKAEKNFLKKFHYSSTNSEN